MMGKNKDRVEGGRVKKPLEGGPLSGKKRGASLFEKTPTGGKKPGKELFQADSWTK